MEKNGVMGFKKFSPVNIILWQMLAGTLGGYTRGFILNKLADKPYNTDQLAEALNIDHETISHHLNVLANNGIITAESHEYGRIYFLSKDMEAKLKDFNQIWGKINL
ncbi:MAG: winged helix-turn-helix domain-containing protein [Candidatus Methanoperedens sp.]|nr:winged helix-turn-helix domain-containing protein [Candidatus Methanoperedens sp.]